MLELDENYTLAYFLLAAGHAARGMLTEALPLAEKAYSLAPWSTQAMVIFAVILRRTGDASRAEELLQPLRNAPNAYGAPRGLAGFHVLCGEIDQGGDWAEKSVEQRDAMAPTSVGLLRSSARWPALAKMMNLPQTV